MASIFHLYCDAVNIKQKIVRKYSEFAAGDKKLYFSAVNIQRTWRGYVVRKMIKGWHEKATFIQKYVRGWLVRLHLPELLKSHWYNLSVIHYNTMATKIQAFWRGYATRKKVPNVKDVLAQRLEIELVSEEMQEQIRESFEELREGARNETRQCLAKILEILFDRHHLLRTKTREGILSIHGSYALSCVEKILQSFPLTEYMKELQMIFHPEDLLVDQPKEKKRFDLNTNVKAQPYEKMLLSQD